MAKKKGSKKGGHRKNPKRVAAGKKAARKRLRKGHPRHKVKAHSRKVKGGKKKVRVKAHMSREAAESKKSRKGYHWVKGHKVKGGGRVKGHWAKNAKRKGSSSSKRKSSKSSKRSAVRHERPSTIYKQALQAQARAERKANKQAAHFKKKYEAAIRREEKSKGKNKEHARRMVTKYQKKVEHFQKLAAEARMRRRSSGHHAAKKPHRKHRSKGRHSRKRNPIEGWGQNLAALGGAVTGILVTVVPYRALRSHKLAAAGQGQGGGGLIDQPAQGDVPNLLTGQLPFYARMKWKGALAVGGYVLFDLILPFGASALAKKHPKTKTFFQVWGWTAVAIGGTKVVVDLTALATKSTAIGQRLFAPENTARDVRAQSSQAQLPAISVAPGLGLPGMTGYGRAPAAVAPKTAVGAGCGSNCGKCDKCKAVASPGSYGPGGMPQNPDVPGGGPGGGSRGFAPQQPAVGAGAPPAPPAADPPAAPPAATQAPRTNIIEGRFQRPAGPPGRFSGRRFG